MHALCIELPSEKTWSHHIEKLIKLPRPTFFTFKFIKKSENKCEKIENIIIILKPLIICNF